MAAFSYGMDARGYDSPNRKAFSKVLRQDRDDLHLRMVGNARFPQIRSLDDLKRYIEGEKYKTYLERYKVTDEQFRALAKKSIAAYEAYDHQSRGANNALNEIYNPLRYVKTAEVEKTLKLPHDYQYDDAKPHDKITARTMFGKEIDLENIDDSTIEAYADWMVSKENPTFTRVIANRLWKRVFGHGVFEPVDELTEQTRISNPELLTYLEDMMKRLDFDMRKYQEVLYNTKTYQRAANDGEMTMGEDYLFSRSRPPSHERRADLGFHRRSRSARGRQLSPEGRRSARECGKGPADLRSGGRAQRGGVHRHGQADR